MIGKIKLTNRMLTKSIIDANKSILAFAKEHLPINYDDINAGERIEIEAVFCDGSDTELRLYRRPRADPLLSIKDIGKKALAGDLITFTHETGAKNGRNWYLKISVNP